jgi:uncharacterized protein YdaU (DUF1376 family)
MHYYQFNIADYRKDTSHLTAIEHYIYRSLIDWYYLDEKPIPTETQVVIRRLSLGIEMVKHLENVLADFFKKTDSGYQHNRINTEIVAYHEMAAKNKVNGKKGGRPRKTQSVISGNPNESQKNPNQEPITNNHKPDIKNKTPAKTSVLPFWLPEEKWHSFREMRKKIKKPLTDEAERLLFMDLEKIRNDGLDPIEAINNSIKSGWQGIFPPNKVNGTHPIKQARKMDISQYDHSDTGSKF